MASLWLVARLLTYSARSRLLVASLSEVAPVVRGLFPPCT